MGHRAAVNRSTAAMTSRPCAGMVTPSPGAPHFSPVTLALCCMWSVCNHTTPKDACCMGLARKECHISGPAVQVCVHCHSIVSAPARLCLHQTLQACQLHTKTSASQLSLSKHHQQQCLLRCVRFPSFLQSLTHPTSLPPCSCLPLPAEACTPIDKSTAC